MNCLWNLLAVCIFDPSNVYLTAGLEATLSEPGNQRISTRCYKTAWCVREQPSGLIGTLKIGSVVQISKDLTIDYGLTHRSRTNTGDRGSEFAFIEMTWRPFR
jgi:hypothetical protein